MAGGAEKKAAARRTFSRGVVAAAVALANAAFFGARFFRGAAPLAWWQAGALAVTLVAQAAAGWFYAEAKGAGLPANDETDLFALAVVTQLAGALSPRALALAAVLPALAAVGARKRLAAVSAAAESALDITRRAARKQALEEFEAPRDAARDAAARRRVQ
jgi:hypothetical protein